MKNIHSAHCFAEGIVFYQGCMVLATSIERVEGGEGVEWPGFHTVGIDLA